jgi:hypothetical protein
MEREAETVTLDERREGGQGEENEGMVWRRRNQARGRWDEQLSVRESPPFGSVGHYWSYLCFARSNQLRPKEQSK